MEIAMKVQNRIVSIGIIGAGGVSKNLHLPALGCLSNVKISWVCDKDLKRAKQIASLYRIPQAHAELEQCCDVDIALVAIPVGFRREVMDKIFKRKWNVFCEKPFAKDSLEFDQYIESANENKVQVGVGLVRRYAPATALARKIVKSGCLGDIVEVWANEGRRAKRTGREADFYMFDAKASGGGVLMETGSHLVDQICMIVGVEAFEFDICYQKVYNGLELETRFVGSIKTALQNKIRCCLEISRLEDLCNGIFIQYSNLILKCGIGFKDPLELCDINGNSICQFQGDNISENAAFSLEWKDFIRQCETGERSLIHPDNSRQSVFIIEECYRRSQKRNLTDV
jgi:predicted dehydrogenase